MKRIHTTRPPKQDPNKVIVPASRPGKRKLGPEELQTVLNAQKGSGYHKSRDQKRKPKLDMNE
jgi:hypothetical protein